MHDSGLIPAWGHGFTAPGSLRLSFETESCKVKLLVLPLPYSYSSYLKQVNERQRHSSSPSSKFAILKMHLCPHWSKNAVKPRHYMHLWKQIVFLAFCPHTERFAGN